MPLIPNHTYFIAAPSVVLRTDPNGSSAPKNHLLFGDWLLYKGPVQNGYACVYCRQDTGWIPKAAIREDRVLEINFLDIGIGDGCHIVTPNDEILLIDAGKTDNMHRFLSWRYNLRNRKVSGVEGIPANHPDAREPLPIHNIVISHPDKDHYYGFKQVFENKKLKVQNIYHNGIVERPIKAAHKDPNLHYYSNDDLGGYLKTDGASYIWDVVHSNDDMYTLIQQHPTTTKNYMQTLRAAVVNNPEVNFRGLCINDAYLPGFAPPSPITIKMLGPVAEVKSYNGTTKPVLKRLDNEGVTKNGHSVVFKLNIGKLDIFLGGDLNTESEDYLIQHYCQTEVEVSKLEKEVRRLKEKGSTITASEQQDLEAYEAQLQALITEARKTFQADVVKACHHGSHHFSETFLQCLNGIVTVVSSGDGDSYAHPRPDALGSFGKYGRGDRPLIFSTEIGRSTREFSKLYDYFEKLQAYQKQIAEAPTVAERKALEKQMQEKKDRNVVVYGMITLRTDGEKVILAQKLEEAPKNDNKWDIHELVYNPNLLGFQYKH